MFRKVLKRLCAVAVATAGLLGGLGVASTQARAAAEVSPNDRPAEVVVDPSGEWLEPEMRSWQGASPGIARTAGGRLFACLFSGGVNEPKPENYAIFLYSDDDGKTWVDPLFIVHNPHEQTRVFDPSVQVDSLNRLWLCWNQQYPIPGGKDFPYGWWRLRIDDPDAPIEEVKQEIRTQTPARMAMGIRINKFIEMSNGEWMQPMAIAGGPYVKLMVSADKGDTWTLRGTVPKGTIGVYEPMVVEKLDGSLWLLTRLGMAQSVLGPAGGVGQAFSDDGGASWSDIEESLPSPLVGSSARLYFGRLRSGALLFITNDSDSIRRVNLTAWLSYDDGKTWPYSLLLDDRIGVGGSLIDGPAYPDCIETDDGRIYVVWDFGRYNEQEMRMTVFTEEDIKAGRLVSASARDKVVVSKRGPYKDIESVGTAIPDSLQVKVGAALADVIAKLPSTVEVTDEDGKTYTLSGSWAGKNYNPQVAGEYEFYYTLDATEEQKDLKDTHKLLTVRVTVKKGGCGGAVVGGVGMGGLLLTAAAGLLGRRKR